MSSMQQEFGLWSHDGNDVVSLVRKMRLVPVEGEGAVFSPPTYAGANSGDKSRYNIDKLDDGTKVCTIDSVGSQANRMEPMFRAGACGFSETDYASLVPQVDIEYMDGERTCVKSIFEVPHRLGDAIVRASDLAVHASEAFQAAKQGNHAPMAKLAPTSLVFGMWDSRETHVKAPRIVQSSIRAWDVSEVTRSAQYTPAIDYNALKVFAEGTDDLSSRGYASVPSTNMPGGIVARGVIEQVLTVAIIPIRMLHAQTPEATIKLRNYILGLSLVAAVKDMDLYLRQGCMLVPDMNVPAPWMVVRRNGQRDEIALSEESAFAFARASADAFGVGPNRTARFDPDVARMDAEPKNASKEKSAQNPAAKKGKAGKAA